MISVSDSLNEIVRGYPFLEEGLARGLINLSALARELKPQIEKKLYKSIKTGAIVMALKRLEGNLNKQKSNQTMLNLTDLTVRSNLVELTYLNSESFADKQRSLLNDLATKKDVFCAFSEGIREVTLIANSNMENTLRKTFEGEILIDAFSNLSSITIKLPKETVTTSGIYYQILKVLAWENINIIEVISTYTELTIIFNTKDIEKAFRILKNIGDIA